LRGYLACAAFRRCSISKEHDMTNVTTNRRTFVTEGIVEEVITAATVAISAFLAMLVFAVV